VSAAVILVDLAARLLLLLLLYSFTCYLKINDDGGDDDDELKVAPLRDITNVVMTLAGPAVER